MRRRRRKAVAVVAAIIAGVSLLVARSFRTRRPTVFPTRGTVRRVVDGDSFYLTNGADVRMLEIDAPEMGGDTAEPARKARQALHELIDWKAIRLEPGRRTRDKYGRFLAYVFVVRSGGAGSSRDSGDDEVREIFVNAEIVRLGLARARTWGPACRRFDEILAAEQEARESRRGMWAEGAE